MLCRATCSQTPGIQDPQIPPPASSRSPDRPWGHSKSPHVASTHLVAKARRPCSFNHLSLHSTQLPPFHLLPHRGPLISFLRTLDSQVFTVSTCPSTVNSNNPFFRRKESHHPYFLQAHLSKLQPALVGPYVPAPSSKYGCSFSFPSPVPKGNLLSQVDPGKEVLLPSPKSSGIPSVCCSPRFRSEHRC